MLTTWFAYIILQDLFIWIPRICYIKAGDEINGIECHTPSFSASMSCLSKKEWKTNHPQSSRFHWKEILRCTFYFHIHHDHQSVLLLTLFSTIYVVCSKHLNVVGKHQKMQSLDIWLKMTRKRLVNEWMPLKKL